jgi:uncharacterized RDD family membrane protein YckC
MDEANESEELRKASEDYTYPSFMGRAGAYIFDGLILTPVFVLLFFVQGKLYTSESMFYPALIIELMFFIIQNSYNVFFTKRFNGTPGKLFFKFRVCREDGMPVTWETSIKRESIYIIRNIIYLICFYAFIAINREKITNFGIATYLHSETLLAKIENWIYFIICIIDFGKALFSPKRITFHDKIAGTVVVYRL